MNVKNYYRFYFWNKIIFLFSRCFHIFLLNSYLKVAQVEIYLEIDLKFNTIIQRIEINKFWKKFVEI